IVWSCNRSSRFASCMGPSAPASDPRVEMPLLVVGGVVADFQVPCLRRVVVRSESQAEPVEGLLVIELLGRSDRLAEPLLEIGAGDLLGRLPELLRSEPLLARIAAIGQPHHVIEALLVARRAADPGVEQEADHWPFDVVAELGGRVTTHARSAGAPDVQR